MQAERNSVINEERTLWKLLHCAKCQSQHSARQSATNDKKHLG